MATIYAIRGLILEEVLLNLLRESGYTPVDYAQNIDENDVRYDETLHYGASGIEVKGRGWNHQIDAIADFIISPPFSYPLRLLLEAKFYKNKVGIDIIRNAVGVLKDVDEYWVSNNTNKIAKPRYHYQYAVFSSSSFTNPAQRYAFAQDIYLIKLENNKYFLPIIESIEDLTYSDFSGSSDKNININLSEFRNKLRRSLKSSNRLNHYCEEKGFNSRSINAILETSQSLRYSFLGVIGERFPIFFTPSPSFHIDDVIGNNQIRICWNEDSWFIIRDSADCSDLEEKDILFSFDLPKELFELYAENNMLSESRALDIKENFMSNIKITFKNHNRDIISSVQLKLDRGWIEEIKRVSVSMED